MRSHFVRISLGLALTVSTPVAAGARPPQPSPPIFVGGQKIREAAIDEGGHLLIPVRGVFAAFGASVVYTPPRFVVVRKNGIVIAGLVVGGRHAVVGNRPRNLLVAPLRRSGRVYVPLRFIAEIAGASVAYSAWPRLVDIHVPRNDITLTFASQTPAELPVPSPPRWAYALVATLIGALVFELVRRAGRTIFAR